MTTIKLNTNLNFGSAIEALKAGKCVCREGWNGKGMFLLLVMGWSIPEEHTHFNMIDNCEIVEWIGMKTAQNQFIPWLASQSDMLSEDWMIL